MPETKKRRLALARQALAEGIPKPAIATHLMLKMGCSRATAYRVIKEAEQPLPASPERLEEAIAALTRAGYRVIPR